MTNLTGIATCWHDHDAFKPVQLGRLRLPGRIVRSATEMFKAHADGHLDDAELAWMNDLATQPLGMIISGHTAVAAAGRSHLGQNAFWSDEFIPDQQRLCRAMQAGGAKAILQIGHGGMKAKGCNGGRPVYTPDNMTVADIQQTVRDFAAAAQRVQRCGYDGVQIHAAHLYLLSEFFYPQYNHRQDAYGGNGERRFRIIREVLEAVRAACGNDFPLLIKINGDNLAEGEDREAYFKDMCQVLRTCESCGVDALELSGYHPNPPEPAGGAEPYFLANAIRLRAESSSSLPMILVGGIRRREHIERAFAAGMAAVSLCRPFMARPDCIAAIFAP
jgi:2,4-dienoyl-CoA reductase-like NADH-dependent reductase (Old Yellow Enzyme family)